jgi:hypothetical protein
MSSLITKYLSILSALSIDTSLGVIYSCFANFSFTLNSITLEQINEWVEIYQSQKIKASWIQQRKMKHPDMIFFFIMMEIRDNTLRARSYQRNIKSNKSNFKNQEQIVKSIGQDIVQLSTFEGIAFLGELIGAWMLTCPESLIRSHANKTKNWQPQPAWLREIYPDTLGNDIPTSDLELLFILDYYLYNTFELILHHNTMN